MWPIEGMSDAFKKSATAPDGKQYFVPISYYPWAVFYRKSVFEKNGWAVPTTMDEMTALMKDMQGKKLNPIAFAAKDAWAPMGTFDILNMRLNGYDFHMALCQGKEKWDSPQVKNVFTTWKDKLLPYQQENALGRTWQEAATSMAKGESGMYLLGTFVVDGVPKETQADLDFFTFPALDQTIGNDALDAPIDGFCVVRGRQEPGVGQGLHQVARHSRGRRRRQQRGERSVHRGQLRCEHGDLRRPPEEVRRAGLEGEVHRPVPRPRHQRRPRQHGDHGVAAGLPEEPEQHRLHHRLHPAAGRLYSGLTRTSEASWRQAPHPP